MEWCLSLLVWLYILTDAITSALVCNYCYAADWKSDCYLNTQRCGEEHVCFSEKNTVLGRDPSRPVPHVTYRMGCEHFSLCLDRVTYGERSSGFTVTNRTCCCRSLCEEPDGVGRGRYDHCTEVWRDKDSSSGSAALSLFSSLSSHRSQFAHGLCFTPSFLILLFSSIVFCPSSIIVG